MKNSRIKFNVSKKQSVVRPTGPAKQSGIVRGVEDNGSPSAAVASTLLVQYTSCPTFDDEYDDFDGADEVTDRGGDWDDDNGVMETVVGSPASSSTPKTKKANAKTRQKRKAPGRKKGQKAVTWTKAERLWLWECIVFLQRGKTLLEGVQGWKAVHELFCKRQFGTTERSEGAIRSQMDVIQRGGLTEMEREEVRQGVAKEQDEMFCLVDGVSVDLSFDLCETSGEGSDVSGAIDFVREQVVDMADGNGMSGSVDAVSGAALVAGNDGRTQQEGPAAGKGGYTLGDRTLDINPTVVLTRQDTWRAADGTERELRGEELVVLGMLRKVRDDGKWMEVPNLRAVERKRIMAEVDLVDGVMHNLGDI